MTTETVTTERYVIRKGMHLGPLRRELRAGDIVEWQPETETFKVNGNRIDREHGVTPSEGMRQLQALSSGKHEDTPAMELLEMASGEGGQMQDLRTSTLCVLPILGCLAAAEKHLEESRGLPGELSPATDEQREFLEAFDDLVSAVGDIPELESRSDDKVEVINEWLKERGFDIQLPPPTDPQGFAVASILDMLLEWLHEGKKMAITGELDKEFTGVRLKDGVTVAHMLALHPHPVVRIATKSGDTVCMSMVDNVPEGISGLFLKVGDLERVKATSHQFEGVCFPMIDLDEQPDISWIKGLEVGSGFRVDEALQQTKFRMNEKGARVQSAAAMTMSRGISLTRPCLIDRPFLLWVRRPGFQFPLFAALLCEDVWKEPKEL